MTTTALAIATTNLTKVYRSGHQQTPVLRGVNLKIEYGHIHLSMGSSESGKTTLLSILAGILAPTSGQVVVLGQEITQLSKAALAKFRLQNIGFVFQNFNLFPALTALENVEIALNLKSIKGQKAKEQAADLLKAVVWAIALTLRPPISPGVKNNGLLLPVP
ncbi:ABC transporter ATP-binding protein [Thermosynechococcus sp.]|uniref:ABC transporter ATP-binding protein n=1 Tax=Thermosynechococcus sp. TaxID=2814275 RepID=UPI00391E0353